MPIHQRSHCTIITPTITHQAPSLHWLALIPLVPSSAIPSPTPSISTTCTIISPPLSSLQPSWLPTNHRTIHHCKLHHHHSYHHTPPSLMHPPTFSLSSPFKPPPQQLSLPLLHYYPHYISCLQHH